MTQPIRIGFVGAGGIVHSRHVPNLQNIEGVELVSVCNRGQDSSERTAQAFGLRKVFTDWRELVHDPDIDVVWIGAWPYLHGPVTLEALAAGKHVFCQARMAMNGKEARLMRDAAKSSGRVTMLCPPPMGMKGGRVMRKILHDGGLGELYTIHFRDVSGIYLDPSAPLSWRQREDLSGFNTLTVGIYAEVVHRWLGYARSVTAQAKTFIPERPDLEGGLKTVTRPDVVMALSEMENGALMRWEWSALASPEPICCLTVYGRDGALHYDFKTDEIALSRQGGAWEPVTIPPDMIQPWTVEQDFIAAVREGKEAHPDFEDGVKYMEFTEAVFRSAESGRRIELPLAD